MMWTESVRDDLELLKGAIDIHVHHGPDLYPRIQDLIELAQSAKDAGMRAICVKTHNFPTVQLAILARKIVPEIDVLGSIACNLQVGGVNPLAVEAAIKYGAQQIWLPTVDSTNHAKLTGGTVGEHGKGLTVKGGISEYARKHPRIYLLDDGGEVTPQVREVIQLIADANVILNLGHISLTEMKAVVRQAKSQRVRKIVCDHPFFSQIGLADQVELAENGVWINYPVGELLPRWWRVSIADFAAALRKVGVGRCVLSSDCGQLHNPPMVEALRIVCQLLIEEGFSKDEIKLMLHDTPAALLYQ
jgi:hypothetical protein